MSSPGKQSRSPQGWGTQLLTALLGNERANPNYGMDQETANAAKGGKHVDVENPYKKAGFRSVFGDQSDVRNIDARLGKEAQMRDITARQDLARLQSQLNRDNFIFENADRIKNIVRENIANKYGITEESHPELYKQYQTQILPGIVQNQFSESQALAAKGANEAGLASDLSNKTRPTRLQAGITEANTGLLTAKTGEEQAAGNLRRQPILNRNLDMSANLFPQRTSIDMQRDSLVPIGDGRMITLGQQPSITSFPSKDETTMASVLGKPAPKISTQPFGQQEGITLSDGSFIPKVGGKVTSPFDNINNATAPMGGSRMMPSNFIRPSTPYTPPPSTPIEGQQSAPLTGNFTTPTPVLNSPTYSYQTKEGTVTVPQSMTDIDIPAQFSNQLLSSPADVRPGIFKAFVDAEMRRRMKQAGIGF